MSMTYETLNWELEAQRVARAFGVEGECDWHIHNEDRRLFLADTSPYVPYVPFSCSEIAIAYARSGRDFHNASSYLVIGFDGKIHVNEGAEKFGKPLARALFHLDLLSPAVESALGVSISHHEKLEWTLEYEARHGVMG